VDLQPGDGLVINVAGINTSGEYAHPHTFNVLRTERQPLSFGLGRKSCVGRAFAEHEMHIFLEWLLGRYTVMHAGGPVVPQLETRWDIANAPITDAPLTLFPNRYVYFVGQSSTGKTFMTNRFRAEYPKACIHSEIARGIMAEMGWARADLEGDDGIYLRLQCLILEEHRRILAEWAEYPTFAIVDRSPIDALHYIASRLSPDAAPDGVAVPAAVGLVGRGAEIGKDLLKSMRGHVIIHFPLHGPFVRDDGVRIPPSAAAEDALVARLEASGLPFHTLRSTTAEERMGEILGEIARRGGAGHD
jgi:hypothetical protein